MVQDVSRCGGPRLGLTSPASVAVAAAAVAITVLAALAGHAEALPYRDLESARSEDSGAAAEVRELAPLARQVDFWRALLRDSDGLNSYLSEEEEALRHLLAVERRRKAMAQQNLLARQQQVPQQQQDVIRARTPLAKRRGSCLFHAGLAQNCDFRDVVGAVNEASHWGSEIAPGKRRR